MILLFVLLPITAYAETFTYEEALELALAEMLNVRNLDAQIRDAEELRRDLGEELQRLERGTWAQERTDELFDLLWEIDMQLWSANTGQEQLTGFTNDALQQFLLGLTHFNEEGADILVSEALQATIMGLLFTQSTGGGIAQLERQRQLIFEELDSLSSGELARELTESTRSNITDINRYTQNLELQQEHARLVRENSLRNAITTVKELDAHIAVAERGLELTQENLRRIALRYELGRVSSNTIRLAQQNVQLQQMELGELQRVHNNAMRNMNHILGQPLTQVTTVIIEHDELPAYDENHIAKIIQQTTTIRQLELEVTRTREARRAYTGQNRETITTLQDAYDRAVLARDQAKLALEVAMRHNFSELDRLTGSKAALKLELTQAELQLETALHNFSLGRITYHEVEQARFAIFVVERNIETVYVQMWGLEFLLDNPLLV